ncbi:DNA helicase, putative [Plasmodium malariae]|uniref:DNA helicase, putative n=1 Tax=Plasmodium malariae TaxID=5858 RepID=A0A1D3JLX6_PLAMA|nr:DNA helicase, putative [Plasmodium malariae]SBT87473.1 DNA helicase, putative [Plasmodium malariae]
MDVFEFVDPLRKRKLTNNLFDFDKYVYKEKLDEAEEKKSDERVLKKKKKKKLRRVLDSSNSVAENEKEGGFKNNKKRNSEIKGEKTELNGLNGISGMSRMSGRNEAKEDTLKKEYDGESQVSSYLKENDLITSNEKEIEEYKNNLKVLFECIFISIKIKNKIIEYFTANEREKRQDIIKEFVKGSFRISNYDANFEDFEKHVDTFHKLKNYQKCGVFWLYILYKEKKNGILADEMGLGKTAQTCVFLDYMYRTGELQNKTIIVAPTSLLKNWNNEINMWCPYLRNHKIIYYGSQNERKYLAYDIFTNKTNNIHLIVTSINMLIGKNDVSYFRQIKKYDYLIFDEAHFLKNKNSLIYKKLQKKIVFNNKILLTGSPIQNKTQELMNLLLFLMPDIFTEENINNALSAFVKMYQDTVNKKDGEEQAISESTPLRSDKLFDIYDIKSERDRGSTVNAQYAEKQVDDRGSDAGVYLTEETSNIIKNYLIEIIRNDVKHVELKNKEIILLQLIIEPYILRRSKKHVFIDMPKKHSVIIKLPLNCTQMNLYKDEIFSKLQHTHKHLEFLQKHSSKSELERISTILEKKGTHKGDKGLVDGTGNKEALSIDVVVKKQSINEADSCNNGPEKGNSVSGDDIGKNDISSMDHIGNNDMGNDVDDDDDDDDKIDEETINIERAEEEENKESNIIINKRDDELVQEGLTTAGKEVRGKMINASIFILRRICNHPLLHKYYYSVEDIKNISKYFYNNTDQYIDLDLKTVENEFMKISDFDIHLSIKHLISQGDTNLNKYLIAKEHILNSTKIHHMICLIREIRQKREKVLIFSQFTTFLDIIEEALLYEFIYDEQDFKNHLQCLRSTQSVSKNEPGEGSKAVERAGDGAAQDGVTEGGLLIAEDLDNTEEKENSIKNKDLNNDYNKSEEKDCCFSSTTTSTSFTSDNKTRNQIYVRLDGSTNTIERQKIIKRFSKSENVFIFLLSTKAGGVGLNLIAANHVILMDQDWNPHNDRQAEDRVHRLGKANSAYCVCLIYNICISLPEKRSLHIQVVLQEHHRREHTEAKLHLDQAFGGNSDLLQSALIKDALNAVDMK